VYRQSQVGLAVLRVMSVDGTQEREIYRGGEQEGKPRPFSVCWSPDGQSLAAIVFESLQQVREGEKLPTIEEQNFRIVILSADGKELRELVLPKQGAVRVTAVNHLDWR
jgi:hypothetical protein